MALKSFVIVLFSIGWGLTGLLGQGMAFAAPDSGFENVVRVKDLDFAVCKAYVGGTAMSPKDEDLRGIVEPNIRSNGWQVVMPNGETHLPIAYLVAFREAIAMGTVQFGGQVSQLSILKPDAPYPPDPSKAEQWQTIAVPPRQSGGATVAMPAGAKARAILISAPNNYRVARLEFVRIMSGRLGNIVPLATAYAESEYVEYSMFAPPRVYAASLVTTGTWYWQNTGKDEQAKIHRAPVTDLDPSWFTLSWDEPQTIRGLWVNDNFDDVRIESYAGPKELNPRAGTDAEWNVIPNQTKLHGVGRFVTFPPISTRGIRLTILKTHDQYIPDCPIAKIEGMHVFVDATDKTQLAHASSQDEQSPVSVHYKMDFDGEATMVINGPDGRRVKNVFARRARSQGENQIGWDLKDEQGRIVPPGTYEWKTIAHPPLHLKYQFTAYPNVGENSPDNPPWLTAMSGPGGWLADHTSNLSGTAGGNYVFFGAPVAESGVSMICCDLTGRKLWAIPSFAGFTGAYHAAATPDGKTVYVAAPGTNMQLDARAEVVWAVDVESHKYKEIARLLPTSARQRGIKSMAARNGKLYIAVGADEDSFASAAGPDDVDIEHCTPVYAAARLPKYPHEVPPNPRDDFERLFRLVGAPAGGHALTYIQSLPGKSARRYVALLFNRPIPIGSAILPIPADHGVKAKLYVLKPDAPYPPNPGDPKQWIPFATQAKLPWDVAIAPPNTRTRALRIMFSHGDGLSDDDLVGGDDASEFDAGKKQSADLKLKDSTAKDDATTGIDSAGSGSWIGKLEGMKLISRRFENVAGLATVTVNSGAVAPDGAWDAKRNSAVSDSDPGVYTMAWKEAQSLRGLAIKEIDGKRTEIDVYVGSETKPVDATSTADWKHIATYSQPRREYYWPDPRGNVEARYLDGYVDFGGDIRTRAVRLRVCEQWQSIMDQPGVHVAGPRWDVKGTDPTRCRIFGVAAMKYIGGEGEAVDPRAFQRIETLNVDSGQVEAEVALPKPIAIAFNQSGAMFGVCGHSLLSIDGVSGKTAPLGIDDLDAPRTFAIDNAGNFYVYDNAPERKNIRVYSPTGKFLRTIGTPGGYRVGPWDPTRFQDVTSLVIDAEQQLWAVDNTYFPKRISLWSLDGTWKKDFLGNTAYGGGGTLDPLDKTRLFYGPLEFALDWTTGHAHLKNLTWIGAGRAGDEPVYVDGRNYMVTRFDPPGPRQECGIVYLYEKDHLRRVAAMGHASEFPPLTKPELQAALGNPSLLDSTFVWSDLNGDGEVQPNEVTLRPGKPNITCFDKDLGIQSEAIRFQVKQFLPNGVPVYEMKDMPGLAGKKSLYRMNDGNFSGENDKINGIYAPDGTAISTYPNEGLSTQGLTSASPYTPEQVVAEFSWVGHTTTHAGDLGEFYFTHTNTGIWNLWTADGMLAGSIFGDLRLPGVRAWNMPEHPRGMSLDGVMPGQEHFGGYFCRTADNHYYAIAGHNHISLVEVEGMDQFKRASGKIEVTPDAIVKTQAWAQLRQRQKVYARTPVLDCYHIENPMPTDGNTRKWDVISAEFGAKDRVKIDHGALFHMAYDAKNLYLCYEVFGLGPMKNTGEQWDRLFKTGAAVDLHIGVDPNAQRDRKAPVAGDKRLLMTFVNDKPVVVLYDAAVAGTPSESAWKAVSPVGQVSFDRVVQLSNVKLVTVGDANRYVVEAAIPLEAIGLKPVDDMRLKMDWGLLSSDPNGNSVMQRLYWSNGATGIIADVPSEAQLHPDLWGYVLFHDRTRHPAGPGHIVSSKEGDNPKSTKKPSIKDIERELNGDK